MENNRDDKQWTLPQRLTSEYTTMRIVGSTFLGLIPLTIILAFLGLDLDTFLYGTSYGCVMALLISHNTWRTTNGRVVRERFGFLEDQEIAKAKLWDPPIKSQLDKFQ